MIDRFIKWFNCHLRNKHYYLPFGLPDFTSFGIVKKYKCRYCGKVSKVRHPYKDWR